jgi:uncharacterized lipoprotein YmbA
MPHPSLRFAWVLTLACWLAACGSAPPAPPLQLHRLPLAAPEAAPAPGDTAGHWQLMAPLRLADHLERDVLWLAEPGSGITPLPGHRYAEPMRETVQRTLVHDLGQLRGADRIWTGPPLPGLRIDRQLRVELQTLEASADGRSMLLRARWSSADPRGLAPPQVNDTALEVPCNGRDAEALVAAQRLALWRLAQRIVQTVK